MSLRKFYLIAVILSLSITFTESQANASMLLFTDIHSASVDSSQLIPLEDVSTQVISSSLTETPLLASISVNSRSPPISTSSMIFMQPSSNTQPISLPSLLANSNLPSKLIPLSSMSVLEKDTPTTVSSEIMALRTSVLQISRMLSEILSTSVLLVTQMPSPTASPSVPLVPQMPTPTASTPVLLVSLMSTPTASSSVMQTSQIPSPAVRTPEPSRILASSLSKSVPSPMLSPTPTFETSSSSTILSTLTAGISPSTIFFSPSLNTSISQSFDITGMMTANHTSLDRTLTSSSIDHLMTESPTFTSTTIRMLTGSGTTIQSPTMVEVTIAPPFSPSPTVTAMSDLASSRLYTVAELTTTLVILTDSVSPLFTETTMTVSQIATEDIITTRTTEDEELATISPTLPTAGSGISTPAVIGMVVAACLVLIATGLLILVLCYCFCRSRKYEYNTGNEYRVTVQKWNAYYTHYTANQCESMSVSSFGSSLMSSFGFRSSNGKTKQRYGGVSSSADHLHTGVTAEMYSTPL